GSRRIAVLVSDAGGVLDVEICIEVLGPRAVGRHDQEVLLARVLHRILAGSDATAAVKSRIHAADFCHRTAQWRLHARDRRSPIELLEYILPLLTGEATGGAEIVQWLKARILRKSGFTVGRETDAQAIR